MNQPTELQVKITGLLDGGWTLQALADELKVHRSSLYEWREGKHSPAHPGFVVMALDALAGKPPPAKRRYPEGHYMQRRARGE